VYGEEYDALAYLNLVSDEAVCMHVKTTHFSRHQNTSAVWVSVLASIAAALRRQPSAFHMNMLAQYAAAAELSYVVCWWCLVVVVVVVVVCGSGGVW
jgi:hypothetical protein